MKIPKNIITYWHDIANIPPEILEAVNQTKAAHPGFNHIFLDDAAGLELARTTMPCFSDYIEKNKIPASRSDIVRLISLYRYGGIYIDASMAFNHSIENNIHPADEVVLVKRDDALDIQREPKKAGVINGIMGSIEGSNFVLECLRKIFCNLHLGIHNYVVHVATGPIPINEVLRDMRDTKGISFLSIRELKKTAYNSHRVVGVSNSWMETQFHGIMDPDYYRDARIVDTIWGEFGSVKPQGM